MLHPDADLESNNCQDNNSDNIVPPPLTSLPHGSLLSQHEIQVRFSVLSVLIAVIEGHSSQSRT